MVNINGHDINVEVHGQQKAHSVVFLHHGIGSIQAWKYQIQPFVDAGYCVIVYDRWGYGKSDTRMRLSMPTFEEDVADLHSLLKEFGLRDVSLIGHSDGGTISLYFSIQFPQYVASLVTIAAHVYVEEKMRPGIEIIRSTYDRERFFRAGLQRVHGNHAERVFNNWYNGWNNPEVLDWDMRPLLADIKCPTLIIQGTDDEHATAQHARDIAEAIPGSQLWLVKGAKHMLPQEEADLFNRKVLDFLNGIYQ